MVVEEQVLRDRLPAGSFAGVHATLRAVEDKIRATYPEAQFQLACGADDELHLSVFTANRSSDAVMVLVEDEQDALEAEHGVFLYLLPLSLDDRTT